MLLWENKILKPQAVSTMGVLCHSENHWNQKKISIWRQISSYFDNNTSRLNIAEKLPEIKIPNQRK